MAADEISLRLSPSGDEGSYGFICPECQAEVNRPASRKTVALLIAAGVEPIATEEAAVETTPLPLEDQNPYPEARSFTLDDVIAFHFLLEDDVALEEMFSLES